MDSFFLFRNLSCFFYPPQRCRKKSFPGCQDKAQWADDPSESCLCWWHIPSASVPTLNCSDDIDKTNDKPLCKIPYRWGHSSSEFLEKNEFGGGIFHHFL